MDEKDVAYFGTLLNEEPDVVKTFAEEGTLGEKISALGLMSKPQVDTLKENYAKEVKDGHITELIEMAKQGNIPQGLYKPINGAVLEKTEKALSKKYEIVDYDSLEDLVGKAIIKNKGQSNDTLLQELEATVEELKGANTKLVEEKDDAEVRIKSDYETQILKRDMADQINLVPFDFSDVEQDKLAEVSLIRKRTLMSVFETTYAPELVDGKIIVKDKEGNVLKNQATLEPVPVSSVLEGLAKELGQKLISPESGGQGGKSSGKSGSRFKNQDEFEAYCREQNINPHSAEGLKILNDSGLKLI